MDAVELQKQIVIVIDAEWDDVNYQPLKRLALTGPIKPQTPIVFAAPKPRSSVSPATP